jgi:hypothetical protein
MTRCLSAMRVHLAQTQSRHLQYRLWPLRADTTPWLRQRAHLGVRWYRSVALRKKAGGMVPSTGCWDIRAETSIPLGRLILQGEPSNHTYWPLRAWLYCRTAADLLASLQNFRWVVGFTVELLLICWPHCRTFVELLGLLYKFCWIVGSTVELMLTWIRCRNIVQLLDLLQNYSNTIVELLDLLLNLCWVVLCTIKLMSSF